ncbi:MAG: hypothetical protein HY321_04580, partial [Armatimonadetes bacterium]|nr:hypothetical protein [Armatimonadota bacterium]
AWQLAGLPEARRELGVDHVVTGYAEGNAAAVLGALARGEALPEVIAGEGVPAAAIPAIRGASTMGVVEISRGCGLGCGFCTIARVPMIHLPEETVAADAATNVAAGQTSIAALSEDLFRYGAEGLTANPGRLLSLLARLRHIEGLRLIQVDHANLTSVAQYSDTELIAVHRLLVGANRHRYLWVNVGVETPSGSLLRANGGGAKMGRLADGAWGEFCAEQVRRLCRAGFFPMASLVLGLPGERAEHVRRALAWVDALKRERLSIFPVAYAPVDGSAGIGRGDLSRSHWELMRACYRLNFRWIPRMYWDNQAGAGVSLAKRLAIRALGQGQVAQWRALFASHARRAGAWESEE